MTEIAEIYLGNIEKDNLLAQKIASAQKSGELLEVSLQNSDRKKGRILTQSDCGLTVGIVKSRDLKLREGDIFQTEQERLLLIHIEAENILVLSLPDVIDPDSVLKIVRLGHLLGNQHYPINIENRKIYVRLTADIRVITQMIAKLEIPDLAIGWEQDFNFEDMSVTSNHHHH